MPDLKNEKAPVRIIVPVSVGYDLKQFKDCLVVVAGRLGCPTCASGRPDCQFIFKHPVLAVNEKLELHDVAPQLDSTASGNRTVKVGLPKSVSNNLDSICGVVDQVVRKIGCLACTSGFDLIFQQELDSLSFQATEEGRLA